MASKDFYLTTSELAASGFQRYTDELDRIQREYQPKSDQMGSAIACNTFALTFLGLLAGGGAASLLYYSGGPSNLNYFVPGIVLGGVSVAFLTWMAIEAIKGTRKKAEEAEQKRLEEEAHITLEEMRKDLLEANINQIQALQKRLTERKRTEFIVEVSRDLCSSGLLLKHEQKAKVLNAFAAYPDALIAAVNGEERPFAVMLLVNLDPENVTDQLLDALYQKIGIPIDDLEADLLADQKRIPSDAVAKILEYATSDRNIPAFSQMMTPPTSKKEAFRLFQHPASLSDRVAHDRPFALAMLTHIPDEYSQSALLNSLFKAIGKPNDANEVEVLACNPLALARYTEVNPDVLSDYPKKVADLVQKYPECFGYVRVDSMVQTMTRGNQAIFLEDMAAVARYTPTLQDLIVSVLNGILPTLMVEQALPERTKLLLQIVKFSHVVVAKHNISLEFMHELCTLMNRDERAQFSKALPLKTWLEGLKQYPEKQFPGFFAIDYFTTHQTKFASEILNNTQLGDEKQRQQYALDLLEHMGVAATDVINALDEGVLTRGFPQFNALTNLLVAEAHARKGQVQSSSRSQLMARFYNARDGRKGKIESSRDSDGRWGACDCPLVPAKTEAWKSFENQAKNASSSIK